MIFDTHKELRGKHATLTPSQPHWLRYSEDQLFQKYVSMYSQSMGTSLHELAETLIKNSLKLKKGDKLTVISHLLNDGIPRNVIDMDRIYPNFMAYVNDAVGFKLTPEQILYYSPYCFGTADAISFRNNFLRIHDLKTGTNPAKMEQLMVYAALFCLEYKVKPGEIEMELRIYQNGEIVHHEPTAEDILPVMDCIVQNSRILERIHEEG
jgi:hypothetical protein